MNKIELKDTSLIITSNEYIRDLIKWSDDNDRFNFVLKNVLNMRYFYITPTLNKSSEEELLDYLDNPFIEYITNTYKNKIAIKDYIGVFKMDDVLHYDPDFLYDNTESIMIPDFTGTLKLLELNGYEYLLSEDSNNDFYSKLL